MRSALLKKTAAILLALSLLAGSGAYASDGDGEAYQDPEAVGEMLCDEDTSGEMSGEFGDKEPAETAGPEEPEEPEALQEDSTAEAPVEPETVQEDSTAEAPVEPETVQEEPTAEAPEEPETVQEEPGEEPSAETENPAGEPAEEPEDLGGEPEWEIEEDELEEYPEATFDFTFRVDTLWETCGDVMIIAVRNAATLISAVNTIDSLGEGEYIIALAADIAMPETMLRFTCGSTTVLGCGHTLSLRPADGGEPGLTVEGEDTVLTLGSGVIEDSLTVTGRRAAEGERYPSLIAVRGGTLKLWDGTVVSDHTAGGSGGAILIESGSAVLLGGAVRNCAAAGAGNVCGGGVCVMWGGSFYMFDGEISGCWAVSADGISRGGGVAAIPSDAEWACEKAPIQLLGGRITDCRANYGGGAVFWDFPGAAVLGGVRIEDNAVCGTDEGAGGGVWYESAGDFALYVFDRCVIRGNVYTDEPLAWPEAGSDEETAEAGAEAEPAIPEDAGTGAYAVSESDLCAAGEDRVRPGILEQGAYISFGDGSETLEPAAGDPEETASDPSQEPAVAPIRRDGEDKGPERVA